MFFKIDSWKPHLQLTLLFFFSGTVQKQVLKWYTYLAIFVDIGCQKINFLAHFESLVCVCSRTLVR